MFDAAAGVAGADYDVAVIPQPSGGATVFFDRRKPPHPNPLKAIRAAHEQGAAMVRPTRMGETEW